MSSSYDIWELAGGTTMKWINASVDRRRRAPEAPNDVDSGGSG